MRKREIKIKILAALFSFLLILSGFKFVKKFREIEALQKKADFLKENLEKIEKENEALKKEIEYFEEPRNLEKEARKRFTLKKEGEKVIIITQ